MKDRPEIPEDVIIPVNNTKKIDFSKPYQFLSEGILWKTASSIWMIIAMFVAALGAVFFSFRSRGGKNLKILKKQGCIIVANHCHYFDTVFASARIFPRKLYITVAQKNFEVPVARTILKLSRAFPIPVNPAGLKMITGPVGRILKRGDHVMFLPEGELVLMSQTIYRFRKGAFYQSYFNQAPVVPIVYLIRKRKFFGFDAGALGAEIIQVIGEPVFPPAETADGSIPKKEIDEMAEKIASWMEKQIEEFHDSAGRKPVFSAKTV